jgi:hypothetical protein
MEKLNIDTSFIAMRKNCMANIGYGYPYADDDGDGYGNGWSDDYGDGYGHGNTYGYGCGFPPYMIDRDGDGYGYDIFIYDDPSER